MSALPLPPWPWVPSPLWAGRIWALNFDPLAFAHPEHWRRHVHPELAARLAAQPRVRGRFLRWLCGQLGLDQDGCFDFAAPPRRLALLDTPDLLRVLRLATLVLCAPALRRFVRPGDRALLQAQLGEADLHFIFHRASRYHWPAELPLPSVQPERLEPGIRHTAGRLLAALTQDYPSPLARRLHLRFPAAEFAPAETAGTAAECAAAWALASAVAVQEINPELQSCFA